MKEALAHFLSAPGIKSHPTKYRGVEWLRYRDRYRARRMPLPRSLANLKRRSQRRNGLKQGVGLRSERQSAWQDASTISEQGTAVQGNTWNGRRMQTEQSVDGVDTRRK